MFCIKFFYENTVFMCLYMWYQLLYELKVNDDGNRLLKLAFWNLSIVPDCLNDICLLDNFVVQTIWDDG
jgi:hypothetical protein